MNLNNTDTYLLNEDFFLLVEAFPFPLNIVPSVGFVFMVVVDDWNVDLRGSAAGGAELLQIPQL